MVFEGLRVASNLKNPPDHLFHAWFLKFCEIFWNLTFEESVRDALKQEVTFLLHKQTCIIKLEDKWQLQNPKSKEVPIKIYESTTFFFLKSIILLETRRNAS